MELRSSNPIDTRRGAAFRRCAVSDAARSRRGGPGAPGQAVGIFDLGSDGAQRVPFGKLGEIGKTLAAMQLVARLKASGWSVFSVSCYRDMPLRSAWQQLLAATGDTADGSASAEAVLRAQQQPLSTAQRGSVVARDVARQQLFERLAERAP